jgi:hypothetical protein
MFQYSVINKDELNVTITNIHETIKKQKKRENANIIFKRTITALK